MGLQAILWDNDGVLVDTERIFFETNREFFRNFSIDLSEAEFFENFLLKDCGIWHQLVDLGYSEAEVNSFRLQRDQLHTRRIHQQAGNLLVPGIKELLARLADRFWLIVVTSASREHFAAIHAHTDLMRYFHGIVAAGDYQNAKPDPQPYIHAIRQFGLSAGECLAIEDSPRGVSAANAAGIRCIAMRSPLTAGWDFRDAYLAIDSIHQLELAILDCASNHQFLPPVQR